MSSEVKANKLSPATGTDVTLGDASDTFTIPASATLDVNGTLDLAGSTMTGFTIPSGQTLTVASGATITNSGTDTGFGEDNTPAFLVLVDGHQTGVSEGVVTKVEFNEAIYDTDSAFDTSTNYRFTVPSGKAGKYYFYGSMFIQTDGGGKTIEGGEPRIRVNGTDRWAFTINQESKYRYWCYTLGPISLDLSVANYVEVMGYVVTSDSGGVSFVSGGSYSGGSWYLRTYFGGYKLPGV